ncbi:N-acetylglucosaminyl-phosphatidylinositol de-N-acetylase [Pleurostoma richardsiae]|uniref:N-acetylglucosaminylphosphatidylinositol deacetylase n=1 Tax=Pleurostoma richardsiae TaxID=41990 RepID=A0AA38S0K8_9PEZI|nr:N-acetylglucosaminyl-phosphatidylinositol de-N-acetylase [Pleurostoma richardsiae]
MDFLLTAGLLLVVLPGLYIYTVSVVQTRFPTLRNKRICLLIAHPDDEAMFFAPTVLALTRPETGNHVKILCLSSGNADGLGETRKKELVKSGLLLGLRKPDDVFVVDNPTDFPDSMTTTWDTNRVSALLSSAFAPHLSSPSSSNQAPTATIDVLITFDDHGISSHPNHVSLYHGARAFVAALVRGRPGWASPVDLYVLRTVSLARKYAGILDAPATLAGWALRTDMKKDRRRPSGLVFMNGLGFGAGGGAELGTAWRAMTRAHRSQMVWFRYGWIVLSRYMVMNDLRLEKVKTT